MTKNDKIYHITSIFSFVLHICVFVFVVAVGFLPYRENENFYQAVSGNFSDIFSSFRPFLMLALLMIACVFSYFAIKRPLLSFWVGALSLMFFLLQAFPVSFEMGMVSFLSRVGEISASAYQTGFKLIIETYYIIYFDIAFFVYAIITMVVRGKK